MNKRVIGIVGVGCQNSNWNADFSGNPKMYLDEYVGSPFALKFAMRNHWNRKGYPVFYRKSYKVSKDGAIQPQSLEERYLSLYSLNKISKNQLETENNLFKAIDIMNFGGFFSAKNNSLSYTGAVQITTGINKYEDADSVNDPLLSPFRNKEKDMASTVGCRNLLIEGHFFYGFTVDPHCYNYIKGYNEEFVGYTEEAYQAFKDACLYSVNNLNTVSKVGCYNEFAMFVELKEGSFKMLTNLNDLVEFNKGNIKSEVNLTKVFETLKCIEDDIDNIDIFYHEPLLDIVTTDNTLNDKVNYYNILNSQKIN